MGLLREPSDWQGAERDRASDAHTHRKVIRRTTHRIGQGAFTCPSCDLPLLPMAPLRPSALVSCPFCEQQAPARSFLRLGAIDTAGNAVHVCARLPAGL
jgi:hypothetical protein